MQVNMYSTQYAGAARCLHPRRRGTIPYSIVYGLLRVSQPASWHVTGEFQAVILDLRRGGSRTPHSVTLARNYILLETHNTTTSILNLKQSIKYGLASKKGRES